MGTRVRLQAIFNMVKAPCIAADIGCDHGLLPIALVKQGKCTKAYACDVREGPLSRAKQAIEEAGLQDRVIPVLSDGLAGLADDVDCVIIAGMGFDTIVHILSSHEEKTILLKQIIVQCNGHIEDFRYWLNQHGYTIDAECIVEDHHDYQLISMHKKQCAPYTKEQCLFGIYMQQDPLFSSYWSKILQKKKEILKNLSIEHEAYQTTKDTIIMIEKQLERLE